MKIRSLLLGAAAGLCITAFGASTVDAQIYTAFTNTIVNKPFTLLGAGRTVLEVDNFREGQAPGSFDPDDGYYFNGTSYGISLQSLPNGIWRGRKFEFEFDGKRDSIININVNGFITVGPNAYFLNTDNPMNLFRKDPPNAVIAPYWGDHYYRGGDDIPQGFIPSEISVKIDIVFDPVLNDSIRVLTVQWRDLNINYNFDPANPNDPLSNNKAPQPSSVGTFQTKIYESNEKNEPKQGMQGNIEFHYSTVGDPRVPGVVKTSGAAVGLESYAPESGAGPTTFMNGLYVEDPNALNRQPYDVPDSVRQQTRLSSTWAPSRANNNVILFRATPQPGITGWGDGDANLSQLGLHRTLPQNQFVTASDVITIMRSVVMNRPLDSLYERGAYHGDVNHNGRYYYSYLTNPQGVRVDIPTRSKGEFEDLPADNTLTSVFYEANEYDAALIMAYMAGKVPTLPWLLDTTIQYGKASIVEQATNIAVPTAVENGNGSYRLPIYLNGTLNGPLGVKFDVNGTVSNVDLLNNDDLQALYEGGRVVIAGKGAFAADQLVGYVVVQTNASEVELSGLRFNDQEKGAMKVQRAGSLTGDDVAVNVFPNPVVGAATVEANLPAEGRYVVAVYDMLGNRVKTLANGTLPAGANSFNWNGTDEAGNTVAGGVYIYRIEGNGVQVSGQMTVVR